MNELVFPSTDTGVLAQVAVVALAGVVAVLATRRRPEMRILVIGVWLTIYGAIGLRALH